MKTFSIILVTIVVFSLFYSCKDGNTAGPSNNLSGDLIPLKVGNKWVSQVMEYDTSGNVTKNKQYIVTIKSDTAISGSIFYRISSTNEEEFFIIRKSDGYYAFSSMGSQTGIVIKYPINVNEKFINFTGDTGTLTSINKSITVPAGTFSCYEYRMDAQIGEGYGYVYYCPGKGFVKEIDYSKNTSTGQFYLSSKDELTSVEIK